MWWFLIGIILFVLNLLYEIFVENEEFTIRDVAIGALIATITGPLYIVLCVVVYLAKLNKKGVKLKKPTIQKKNNSIDPVLFEGDQQIYNDFQDRVKQKLKEFNEQ